VALRDCRYLNNIVEQDHRAIKQRCASMLGFKSFHTAAVTLSGIELAHRIRKRQFWVDWRASATTGTQPSIKQLWDRALAAEPTRVDTETALIPPMHQNSRVRALRVRSDAPRRYPRKVFSGGGLYMYLTPNGRRHWRYKYRYAGKEKTLSLGRYPYVSAESAKARHHLARRLLAAGVDPALRKDQVRRCSAEHDDTPHRTAAFSWVG
jgi:hypothetical protein